LFVLKYKNNKGVRGNKDGLDTILYTEGMIEAQKNNLLDELSKRESKMKIVKELFSKIKNKFGETIKMKQKMKQLRIIEQRKRTCNKYVQKFKKII